MTEREKKPKRKCARCGKEILLSEHANVKYCCMKCATGIIEQQADEIGDRDVGFMPLKVQP